MPTAKELKIKMFMNDIWKTGYLSIFAFQMFSHI